jgi:hypothetical protein
MNHADHVMYRKEQDKKIDAKAFEEKWDNAAERIDGSKLLPGDEERLSKYAKYT